MSNPDQPESRERARRAALDAMSRDWITGTRRGERRERAGREQIHTSGIA